MNITFRQLRVFTEVARDLSFARAAERLHLTPPAVTMQVKEVESQVGFPLFDRQGRHVTLTTAGEYFLVYARRLLATLKDAEDTMARLRKLEAGLLTIGLVTTAQYFLPQLLVRFQHEHPGVDVRLRVGASREALLAQLRDGEVDLAVMGRPPVEMATRAEAFAAHPLVFVAPPGHPLATHGDLPAKALEAAPFVAREPGSGTRAAMEAFLRERRVTPFVTMEMQGNETIKQAVMAGMGLGFLSLHTIALELEHGLLQLLHVESTPVMRTWNLVHLLAKTLSPAAEAFRYFMLEHAEAFLAERDAPLLQRRPS